MPEKGEIRLLIVDDHPVVLDGLCAILGHQPDMNIVATARDCQSAVREFRNHSPDVTLMDLHLPDQIGVVAISQIREINPRARIIVLTTYSDEEDVVKSVQAGASGYLLKDCERTELAETVREVYHYKTVIPAQIASRLAAHIGRASLSKREIEVLHLLAAAKSNKEIAVALGISVGTAKSHVTNLFRKLAVPGRMEAINVARQRGLLRGD